MTGIIVIILVMAVFWVLAFFSKRRFGVLGLALAAGALLSMLWSGQLVGIVERSGITLASISTAGLVSAALVLLPAVLLLFSGPSYRNKHGRIGGATCFAIFATVLVAESISSALVLDSASRAVFDGIMRYQVYIVTIGVILALLDMLAIHTVGGGHTSKGKH